MEEEEFCVCDGKDGVLEKRVEGPSSASLGI